MRKVGRPAGLKRSHPDRCNLVGLGAPGARGHLAFEPGLVGYNARQLERAASAFLAAARKKQKTTRKGELFADNKDVGRTTQVFANYNIGPGNKKHPLSAERQGDRMINCPQPEAELR